jgi:penicillin-binding protein 1A
LITRVVDKNGKELHRFAPIEQDDSQRAIAPRNAFMMSQLLNEVTRSGTAARAQATLQRPDVFGKTGTTNDSMDAWFAGYNPSLTAITWIGYDTPRKLGDRETGGGLSLPVWIDFMQQALKGVPVNMPTPPDGVAFVGGEWYYKEFIRDAGVVSLGMGGRNEGARDLPPQDEKRRILDLFKH